MSSFTVSDSVLSINTDNIYLFNLNSPPDDLSVATINVNEHIKDNKQVDCTGISPCGHFMTICTYKKIIFYSITKQEFIQALPIEKTAICVRYCHAEKTFLIADRSGHVTFYSYSTDQCEKLPIVLGHNSMLTDALFTSNDDFIITSDRDEKIRVSHFPDVYNIQSFCMGHKSFVSSISILPNNSKILVSTSGDGFIKLWNFEIGEEILNFFISSETNVKIVLSKINDSNCLLTIQMLQVDFLLVYNVRGNLSDGFELIFNCKIQTDCSIVDVIYWNNYLLYLNGNNKLGYHPSIDNLLLHKVSQYVTDNCKIQLNNTFTLLFKRHYDNVKEYQLKKKARLDSKNKPAVTNND